jgi:pilus assembly protein Flp/PilA
MTRGARVVSVITPRERRMKNLLKRLVREDEGQDLVEYALLIAGIGLVVMTGVETLGTAIDAAYTRLIGDVNQINAD